MQTNPSCHVGVKTRMISFGKFEHPTSEYRIHFLFLEGKRRLECLGNCERVLSPQVFNISPVNICRVLTMCQAQSSGYSGEQETHGA